MNVQLHYMIPHTITISRVLSDLKPLLAFIKKQTETAVVKYFDTFDFRLFSTGFIFAQKEARFELLKISSSAIETTRINTKRRPVFAGNFPGTRLKRLMSGIIAARALLPVISTFETIEVYETERPGYKLSLDCRLIYLKNDTTSESSAHEESAAEVPLASIIRIDLPQDPGLEEGVRRTFGLLGISELSGFEPIYRIILGSGERTPGAYTKGIGVFIDPQEQADTAVKKIFEFLLFQAGQSTAGIIDDIDTEFLHDFRVAVRRMRSLITLFGGFLAPEKTEAAKKALKAAIDTTGPLRDLDVFLSKKPELSGFLTPEALGGLSGIFTHLKRKRRKELARVAVYLRSEEYKELHRAITDIAESGLLFESTDGDRTEPAPGEAGKSGEIEPIPERRAQTESTPPSANRLTPVSPDRPEPIIGIVAGLCEGRFSVFASDLGRITKKTKERTLHKFRISLKKMRYLMEFFEPLFSERKVKRLIKILKRLQEALGMINDRDIELSTIFKSRDEISPSGAKAREMLTALGALGQHLYADKKKLRKKLFSLIAKSVESVKKQPVTKMFKS